MFVCTAVYEFGAEHAHNIWRLSSLNVNSHSAQHTRCNAMQHNTHACVVPHLIVCTHPAHSFTPAGGGSGDKCCPGRLRVKSGAQYTPPPSLRSKKHRKTQTSRLRFNEMLRPRVLCEFNKDNRMFLWCFVHRAQCEQNTHVGPTITIIIHRFISGVQREQQQHDKNVWLRKRADVCIL